MNTKKEEWEKYVDNTKINMLEWCAGYGGIGLGLKRAIPTMRTIAFCEIEAFACANLVSKMESGLLDSAPIWTDLKTFPCQEFHGLVDILVAGYPCQPFSAAGKRLGAEDPRHLWPFIRNSIQTIRPRICFFENVEGHVSLGLSTVLSDLEEDGYQTAWGIFSASEIGAPHQRKRVFILAYDQRQRVEELCRWISGKPKLNPARHNRSYVWPSRPGEPQHGWEPPRVVANTQSSLSGIETERKWREDFGGGSPEKLGDPTAVDGSGQNGGLGAMQDRGTSSTRDEREIESTVGRDLDGNPDRLGKAELYVSTDNRTDELRLLGNGVVPATAEKAFITLLKEILKDLQYYEGNIKNNIDN